ncbi:hypothetical protein HY604_03355 [Candidatus Peregrinibacteria bacterium]|nr:hypothetical protein [Candidatus Peregrinibacteria bacterium]
MSGAEEMSVPADVTERPFTSGASLSSEQELKAGVGEFLRDKARNLVTVLALNGGADALTVRCRASAGALDALRKAGIEVGDYAYKGHAEHFTVTLTADQVRSAAMSTVSSEEVSGTARVHDDGSGSLLEGGVDEEATQG